MYIYIAIRKRNIISRILICAMQNLFRAEFSAVPNPNLESLNASTLLYFVSYECPVKNH